MMRIEPGNRYNSPEHGELRQGIETARAQLEKAWQ